MVFSPRDEAEIAQVAIRVSRGEPSKRTEGAELCGGDSIPEVHGGRGCRPPRSRPGSEGWSWGPAEAAEGACEAAAAGTGLRTAEAVPRSLQQLSTRCGPPQTDCPSVGTACPPPPALLISSLTFALPLSRLLFPLVFKYWGLNLGSPADQSITTRRCSLNSQFFKFQVATLQVKQEMLEV
uniref:uncharacterized protein LOC143311871 n=1 Tax=Arvicanthis niloticus TaxID=61156 RepID=UPI00402B9E4F